MIKSLLNVQWRLFVNTIRSNGAKGIGVFIVSLAALTFFIFLLSKMAWGLSEFMSPQLIEGVFPYISLLSIAFILLLGVPQVFKNLYAENDLAFLFTLPIPTRSIFWVKYIQSFVGTPLLIFLLTFVPFVTYGAHAGASFIFYPVVFFLLLSNCIIGLSLAYLFNLGLIQILPANRANELMTVMSALSGLLIYGLFQLPNMVQGEPLGKETIGQLPTFPKWLPISWGGDAISSAVQGTSSFIMPTLLLILISALFALLSSTLVEKGFRTGWIRLSEGGNKKKKKEKQKTRKGRLLYHPIIAVGIKEWRSIQRDLREWMVFMPLGFFAVFAIFGLFSSGASISDLRGNERLTWVSAQAIFLFIYAMSNGPVSASTIAREAKSMSILRMLPLTGRQIAYGKFWISWLLPWVILSVIQIVIGILLNWSIWSIIIGILLTAAVSAGFSGMGIWLGTIGAKYNPANPQNRLKLVPSILLLILSYVYLFITAIPFGILMIPKGYSNFFTVENDIGGIIGGVLSTIGYALEIKAASPNLAISAAIVSVGIISFGTAALTLSLGAKRLDKGIKIEMVQGTIGRKI